MRRLLKTLISPEKNSFGNFVSCAIRLPSWDKLEIPLPFSRAELVIGKPFYLDEDALDPEKMPLAKEKIRLALLAVTPGN